MSASQFDTPCTATSIFIETAGLTPVRPVIEVCEPEEPNEHLPGWRASLLSWAFVSSGTTGCYTVMMSTQEFWNGP